MLHLAERDIVVGRPPLHVVLVGELVHVCSHVGSGRQDEVDRGHRIGIFEGFRQHLRGKFRQRKNPKAGRSPTNIPLVMTYRYRILPPLCRYYRQVLSEISTHARDGEFLPSSSPPQTGGNLDPHAYENEKTCPANKFLSSLDPHGKQSLQRSHTQENYNTMYEQGPYMSNVPRRGDLGGTRQDGGSQPSTAHLEAVELGVDVGEGRSVGKVCPHEVCYCLFNDDGSGGTRDADTCQGI